MILFTVKDEIKHAKKTYICFYENLFDRLTHSYYTRSKKTNDSKQLLYERMTINTVTINTAHITTTTMVVWNIILNKHERTYVFSFACHSSCHFDAYMSFSIKKSYNVFTNLKLPKKTDNLSHETDKFKSNFAKRKTETSIKRKQHPTSSLVTGKARHCIYSSIERLKRKRVGSCDTFALRLPFVSMSRQKIVNPRHLYSKGPLAARKFTFSPFRHRPTKSGAEMVFAVHRMPILVF